VGLSVMAAVVLGESILFLLHVLEGVVWPGRPVLDKIVCFPLLKPPRWMTVSGCRTSLIVFMRGRRCNEF